ncbi:MAG: class I SAM-dependent methyltransferase [Alphaproteobacteria bacterium]|nr:class I SAM-dependent methyltransferase [Alphaproteobacteria bacterium]
MATNRPTMLLPALHDERARQDYSASVRKFVGGPLMTGSRELYREVLKPAFERKHGRPPARYEVWDWFKRQPSYQWSSALRRTHQEQMWDSALDLVERQYDDLVALARREATKNRQRGSLRLDDRVTAPRYLTAVDIHCMPGNYHTDRGGEDVAAGALYDRAIASHGYMGPDCADVGVAVAAFARHNFPHLRVNRLLDLGCTVGHSTLAYSDAFPQADIQAIDVAAPCLRYAHARAEMAGKAVHFSQQTAEQTDFADESFDLVVSTIILHETSATAIRNVFRECRRLLRPGGVMLHCESRQYFAKEPFDAQWHAWGAHYNAEPFMRLMHETELKDLAIKCGFRPDRSFPQVPMLATLDRRLAIKHWGRAPTNYPESLYVCGAVK